MFNENFALILFKCTIVQSHYKEINKMFLMVSKIFGYQGLCSNEIIFNYNMLKIRSNAEFYVGLNRIYYLVFNIIFQFLLKFITKIGFAIKCYLTIDVVTTI